MQATTTHCIGNRTATCTRRGRVRASSRRCGIFITDITALITTTIGCLTQRQTRIRSDDDQPEDDDAEAEAKEAEAKRLRAMAAADAAKPKTIAQGWVAVTREKDPTSFIMVGIEEKKLALTGFGTGVTDFVKQLDEEKVQFGVLRIVCVDTKQQNNIGKKVAGQIKYAGITFIGRKVPALTKFKVSSKFKQMAASLGLTVTHEFSEKADINIQSVSKLLIQAGLKPHLFDFGKAGKHEEILLSAVH